MRSKTQARAQTVTHQLRPPIVAAVLLVLLLPLSVSALTRHDTGRWTPAYTMTGTAVHMALMRSPDTSAYHSKILWWYGLGDEHYQHDLYGGLWGWKAGDYDGASWPSSNFVNLSVPLPTDAKIFCAGISHTDTGQVFIAGGTQEGTENGMQHAWIFDPRTTSWTQVESMKARRWYPTATELASGKILVTSGSVGLDFMLYGGLVGSESAPSDPSLQRFGIWGNGVWESTVHSSSTPLWPKARVGHAGAWSTGTSALHVFGGKDPDGNYLQDMWLMRRQPNVLGSDYDYTWEQLAPEGGPPSRCIEASVATDTSIRSVLFGGIIQGGGGDVAIDDAWLLWRQVPSPYSWHWKPLTIDDTNGSPGPLCGHSAFIHWPSRKMFIFGGRSTPTGDPTDGSVWAIAFDDTLGSPRWEHFNVSGPSPRTGQAMGFDPSHAGEVYFFGGEDADGHLLNDLWKLTINNAGTSLTWTDYDDSLSGTPPAARRDAAMVKVGDNRLYIFGGTTGSGVSDTTVYAAQVEHETSPTQPLTWTQQDFGAPARTGQIAAFASSGPFTRIPEVFSPATGHWDTLAAPHLEEWYPQTFSVGNDSVFVSGRDKQSYYLRVGAQQWTAFPSTPSTVRGGSSVLYRPGKVMKCGSSDTDLIGGTATGATAWIDLRASSPTWTTTADSMIPRVNHNLVILPTGEVAAIGGLGVIADNMNIDPVYQPEIWHPAMADSANDPGFWYGDGVLESSPVLRGYHSTALLLPDGRILSAGGNETLSVQVKANIFCPPYLYDGNSLATRPVIQGAPDRIDYWTNFPIAMSYAPGDTIMSVCLIKPAAVTHGFDESQRYVRLTIDYASSNHDWIEVTAPANTYDAPPGDYMLFAVDNHGVPAIARWVRLGAKWDCTGDNTAPDAVNDLEVEIVESHALGVTWTSTGDNADVGLALKCDLRYSTSNITSGNFSSAIPITPQLAPAPPGTSRTVMVGGLASHTKYYFAIKTTDECGHTSTISNVCNATTLSGGGGSSAGGEIQPASEHKARTESEGVSEGTTGTLVAEYAPTENGVRWMLSRTEGVPSGLHAEDTTGVVVQDALEGGGWRNRHVMREWTQALGIGRLVRPGRVVFLKRSDVAEIQSALAAYALTGATNPDAPNGTLIEAVTSAVSTDVSSGNAVTLEYSAALGDTAAPDRFFVVTPGGRSGGSLSRRGGIGAPSAPKLGFALMPSRPNPFSHSTEVAFTLPQPSTVRLQIFDTQGRLVRTLANGSFDAGQHVVNWDRTTDAGTLAPSGIYWYRIDAGPHHAKRKMVVL